MPAEEKRQKKKVQNSYSAVILTREIREICGQIRVLRVLRGESPEDVTKMSQIQNEPNGMLPKPYSKPKNRDFGNFTKPFYAKRTQWYVIY
jgi:hypothetical protein